jgi:predicted phosphate transport protein (TIGR00153 family)
VKLRLLPPDRSFFDLFEAAGDNLAQCAALLRDLVEDYVDPETKAKRLADCEHEGDRLTQALLVRLCSSARPPFDRDDVHALATRLDDVTDALEEAADMLVLHKVTEPIGVVTEQADLLGEAAAATAAGIRRLRTMDVEALRAYAARVEELERAGDRIYRRARAELYTFEVEQPARYVLVWKDIIEQLEEALDAMRRVAQTVDGVVLRNG